MIYTFNALFRPPYATDTECSRRHLSDFEKQFELCFLEIKERKVTMVPHNDTAVTEHVGASGDLLCRYKLRLSGISVCHCWRLSGHQR